MDGLEVSSGFWVLYCEHGTLLHLTGKTVSAK